MDFRQLEAFIATVDHQSFSAAADALYLSQPTISSYIHSLERELNTQLIRRTTKKFEVTVNGHQLYEYAVALLRLQQSILHYFTYSITTRRLGSVPMEWVVIFSMSCRAAWIT